MSLNVATFYADMRLQGGLMNTPDTESQFIRAVNSTLGEFNGRMGTEYDEITAATGTIACESYEEPAMYSGAKYFLQRQGAWAQDPDAEAYAIFRQNTNLAMAASIKAQGTDFKTRNEAA